MAAHGSKSRVKAVGWEGILELISASVASLPLDVAELLELIDIGRFFDADIMVMTVPPRYLQNKKVKCQSADRIKYITED